MLPEWVLGAVLSLLVAVLSNIGLAVQKLSHTNAARSGNESVYFLRRDWLLGLAVFLTGQLCHLFALGLASQSLVATLSSASVVSNVFVAPLILHERVHWTDYVSMLLFCAGSTLVVLSCDHRDQLFDLPALRALAQQPPAIAYVCSMLAALLILTIIFYLTASRAPPVPARRPRVSYQSLANDESVAVVSSSNTSNTSSTSNTSNTSHTSNTSDTSSDSSGDTIGMVRTNSIVPAAISAVAISVVPALCLSTCAAICASMSVLSAKCAFHLLRSAFFASPPSSSSSSSSSLLRFQLFTHADALLVFVALLCFALSAVHVLNMALRRGRALLVLPVYYVASLLFTIGGGLFFFAEIHVITTPDSATAAAAAAVKMTESWRGVVRGCAFGAGVVLVIAGVLCAARRGGEEEEEEEAEEEAGEAAGREEEEKANANEANGEAKRESEGPRPIGVVMNGELSSSPVTEATALLRDGVPSSR